MSLVADLTPFILQQEQKRLMRDISLWQALLLQQSLRGKICEFPAITIFSTTHCHLIRYFFISVPHDTYRNGLVLVQQMLIPPNLLSSITAQYVL